MRPALLTFSIVLGYAECARILGLFPHTGRSHQMVFEPLLKALANRGHDVTVASFFPLKNPPINYTDISFEGIASIGIETVDLTDYENPPLWMRVPLLDRLFRQIDDFHPLADMALETCRKAVDWPPLIDALKKDYDVVLVENFNSDCMIALLHVYEIKAPIVSLLSSNLLAWSAERIGISDNPAFVPSFGTMYQHPMTFWERLENVFVELCYKLWFRNMVQIKEQAVVERRYGKIPDLGSLAGNVSLMLVNTHHTLHGRKALPPGIVEVGGMHLDPVRKHIPQVMLFLNNYTYNL